MDLKISVITMAQCGGGLLRPVGGRSRFRLPDRNARDSRAVRGLANLLRRLIVNVPRDIFRRGVQRVEGRKLVQIFVVERSNHALNYLLEMHKVVEQPDRIELLAREDDAHLVVVAVEILALSFVVAQVVRRGECLINADLVHGPSFEFRAIYVKQQVPRRGSYSRLFSMKRATSARSCVVLYSGRDSRKILPYCIRWMRLSRIARMPRSVFERISLPNPCFNA